MSQTDVAVGPLILIIRCVCVCVVCGCARARVCVCMRVIVREALCAATAAHYDIPTTTAAAAANHTAAVNVPWVSAELPDDKH